MSDAPWVICHDEYDGDAGMTDWSALANVAPFAWVKAEEGLRSGGNEQHFVESMHAAHAVQMQIGAYDWPLFHTDGKTQAERFVAVCAGADAHAVDLETADQPAGVTKADVLNVMHPHFDRFHELLPTAPLVVYGASLLDGLFISWAELVGNRDWILGAWLPRYSGGGDIRGWSRAQIIDYGRNGGAGHYRGSIPVGKIVLVQFTNGTFGPTPHTLAGLNRNEDLSVLLVPLETLTGKGEDEMALLNDLDQGSKDQRAGKPIPKGASAGYKYAWYQEQRIAAAAKSPAPESTSGVSKAQLAKHAADGEAHHHHHSTGLPQA